MFDNPNPLPPSFWSDAVQYAVLQYNVRPHSYLVRAPSALPTTPYERLYGVKPDVMHLRASGCLAHARLHDPLRATNVKLAAHTVPCRFLGFPTLTKGIKVFDPSTGKTHICLDVTFNDHAAHASDVHCTQIEHALSAVEPHSPEPVSFATAVAPDNQEARAWQRAVESELESLATNKTWVVTPLPPGCRAITAKWVFKRKRNADGTIAKYKARLVARGFTQIEGIDFTETFAPVVRMQTLRLLIALALNLGFLIHQLDVVTAFLNGILYEEIYMRPPPGVSVPDGYVLKLLRSLYSLKQAGREWHIRLCDYLTQHMGFVVSHTDPSLFIRRVPELILLAVYVDDILVAACSDATIVGVKRQLTDEFKMTDSGLLEYVLGIRITRTAHACELSQASYTVGLRYAPNIKARGYAPTAKRDSGYPRETSEKLPDDVPFHSCVSALMYLATSTRPDIAFAVSTAAQYLADPCLCDWQAVTRILRYLAGTVNQVLRFEKSDAAAQIYGFTDADWGSDIETRRSCTGYVFAFGTPGSERMSACISWQSKRQVTIAMSSTESEYMAYTAAAKEAMWYRTLLHNIRGDDLILAPIVIFCDNQPAQALAENPIAHACSKHIDVRHHFIREALNNKLVKLVHVNTNDNVADILTKHTTSDTVQRHSTTMDCCTP
ncbi:DNA-directed DNA polymerase [Powellomyces hirtus]|uniref:DNA-directed DNA polymerase n=1 Tax=Powellomyces hirtus TaxID=109895 RepID=A0A507DZK9_9FUNG|nr:DNA-directed DNA polymerase [Powellomyces hirtus]